MTKDEPSLEPDVLAAWVELMQRTPCRKCKSTAWTLAEGMRWTHGGARVGIFVVLGPPQERVVAISFTCNGCQAVFERPAYSRAQLGRRPQHPCCPADLRSRSQTAPEPSFMSALVKTGAGAHVAESQVSSVTNHS